MTAATGDGNDSSDMGKVVLMDLVLVLLLKRLRICEEWKAQSEPIFKGIIGRDSRNQTRFRKMTAGDVFFAERVMGMDFTG